MYGPPKVPGTPQCLHLGLEGQAWDQTLYSVVRRKRSSSCGGLNPQGQKAPGNPISSPYKFWETSDKCDNRKICPMAKSPQAPPTPCLLACGKTCSVCVSRSHPCPSRPHRQPAPHLLHDVPVLCVHLSERAQVPDDVENLVHLGREQTRRVGRAVPSCRPPETPACPPPDTCLTWPSVHWHLSLYAMKTRKEFTPAGEARGDWTLSRWRSDARGPPLLPDLLPREPRPNVSVSSAAELLCGFSCRNFGSKGLSLVYRLACLRTGGENRV